MIRILTYHRVAKPSATPALEPRLISTTPAMFAQQMRYLARHYAVVSLEDVLHAVTTRAQLPKRAVLITFDDAYRDVGDIAWPILQRYQLPATLFVPTWYPDHPERAFWWDRLYYAIISGPHTIWTGSPLGALPLATTDQRHISLRRLQVYLKTLSHTEMLKQVDSICLQLGAKQAMPRSILNWEELRQLAHEGMTLAAHTRTHPMLTQLTPKQMQAEITGAQEDLQREIGRVLPVFCYPGGDHDARVRTGVREAGFILAFATRHGATLYHPKRLNKRDRLRLRRTNITLRTSLSIFRLRLSRPGNALDRLRYRWRDRLASHTRT